MATLSPVSQANGGKKRRRPSYCAPACLVESISDFSAAARAAANRKRRGLRFRFQLMSAGLIRPKATVCEQAFSWVVFMGQTTKGLSGTSLYYSQIKPQSMLRFTANGKCKTSVSRNSDTVKLERLGPKTGLNKSDRTLLPYPSIVQI